MPPATYVGSREGPTAPIQSWGLDGRNEPWTSGNVPHRYSHDGRYRAAGVAIIAQEGSFTACPYLSSEVGYSALMLLELVIDL